MTDLIVRELRLRPFTDAPSAPAAGRSPAEAAEGPHAKKDALSVGSLSARHSRRREVDDRGL
ncbi:MAG: hypothetical protein ABI352_07430 [Candidatus Dormibacter sp.]